MNNSIVGKSEKPVTKANKQMSVKHLSHRLEVEKLGHHYDESHIKDHKKSAKKAEKNISKIKKLIAKRMK